MKRLMLMTVAALFATTTTASAATLTVTPDKTEYLPGETITLTINGDIVNGPTGDLAQAIIGTLLFDGSLAGAPASATQNQLNAFGGFVQWTLGVLTIAPGSATVFNQVGGLSPTPSDVDLVATLTLTALAPGVVDFDWAPTLSFFNVQGAQPGVAASITIVPEPGTLLLLGSGLVGLLVAGRRS